MTPEDVSERYLSLRAFLERTVMPCALGLIFVLFLLRGLGIFGKRLDLFAVTFAIIAVGISLYRAIDLMTARLVHLDLMSRYARRYREALNTIPAGRMSFRELSRLLAWMDRELR